MKREERRRKHKVKNNLKRGSLQKDCPFFLPFIAKSWKIN
jgi:hypothetical protein